MADEPTPTAGTGGAADPIRKRMEDRLTREATSMRWAPVTATKIPHIDCAICGKLVDRVEVVPAMWTQAVRIRVWCHGDRDEMELNADVLQNMREEDMRRGTAFLTKRIGGCPKGGEF